MSRLDTLARAGILLCSAFVLMVPAVAHARLSAAFDVDSGVVLTNPGRSAGDLDALPPEMRRYKAVHLERGPSGDPALMHTAAPAWVERALATPWVPPVPPVLPDEGGVLSDDVPWEGSGDFHIVPGTVDPPDPSRNSRTILIRVEEDVPVDPEVFAEYVMDVLNSPRGWGEIDNVSFGRTDEDDDADFVLNLSTPTSTDELCSGLATNGRLSCGRVRTININADRWVHGAEAFFEAGGTLEEYRAYLINHESGHSLGHGHEPCGGQGSLAPVMLQQTLHLQGCVPNGWPNP